MLDLLYQAVQIPLSPIQFGPLDFVIMVMACWQAVETTHHGSIFGWLRSELQIHPGFWGALADCVFCHGHWFAGFVAWYYLATAGTWMSWPIIALAVVRGAQVANDFTWWICRTPNRSGRHKEASQDG